MDEDWDGYRRLVLSTLEELKSGQRELQESMKHLESRLTEMGTHVTELRVRAAMMGAAFGILGTVVVNLLLAWMERK